MKAYLSEIFESIQGEGVLLGTRQIFVRFCGCNLACPYCDTLQSREKVDSCLVFLTPGARSDVCEYANPLTVTQIVAAIQGYRSRWVSLTGGEPLLWPGFLRELGSTLVGKGYRVLLETNGTLARELNEVLEFIDMVSMDFKLPSAVGVELFSVHRRFLKTAVRRPVYVKVVVTPSTEPWEIGEVARIIAGVDAKVPLVLQPVSGIEKTIPAEQLLALQVEALHRLEDVRVIPQVHKLLGMT